MGCFTTAERKTMTEKQIEKKVKAFKKNYCNVCVPTFPPCKWRRYINELPRACDRLVGAVEGYKMAMKEMINEESK